MRVGSVCVRERKQREEGKDGERNRMKCASQNPCALRKFSKASFLIHLFSQVLEEPTFRVAYANLCKVMSTIKVEVPTEPKGKPRVITFRRILLTKCQQEFEKDMRDDEEREKILNAIKETEDVSSRIICVCIFVVLSRQ